MADVTISGLSPITPSAGLFLPASNSTTTGRVSISDINSLASGVPIGTIVMWSNYNGASIPSGWQLCDGTNNTPNLKDKFIVGAGGAYALGSTGGASSITPEGTIGATSLNSSQQISLNFGRDVATGCYEPNVKGSPKCNVSYAYGVASYGGSHSHPFTGTSHTNLPPYQGVFFIIKVS